MATALVYNKHSGNLSTLHISPDQSSDHRLLSSIVIHAAASLFYQTQNKLLCPLVTLLTKPGDMQVITEYWPHKYGSIVYNIIESVDSMCKDGANTPIKP